MAVNLCEAWDQDPWPFTHVKAWDQDPVSLMNGIRTHYDPLLDGVWLLEGMILGSSHNWCVCRCVCMCVCVCVCQCECVCVCVCVRGYVVCEWVRLHMTYCLQQERRWFVMGNEVRVF